MPIAFGAGVGGGSKSSGSSKPSYEDPRERNVSNNAKVTSNSSGSPDDRDSGILKSIVNAQTIEQARAVAGDIIAQRQKAEALAREKAYNDSWVRNEQEEWNQGVITARGGMGGGRLGGGDTPPYSPNEINIPFGYGTNTFPSGEYNPPQSWVQQGRPAPALSYWTIPFGRGSNTPNAWGDYQGKWRTTGAPAENNLGMPFTGGTKISFSPQGEFATKAFQDPREYLTRVDYSGYADPRERDKRPYAGFRNQGTQETIVTNTDPRESQTRSTSPSISKGDYLSVYDVAPDGSLIYRDRTTGEIVYEGNSPQAVPDIQRGIASPGMLDDGTDKWGGGSHQTSDQVEKNAEYIIQSLKTGIWENPSTGQLQLDKEGNPIEVGLPSALSIDQATYLDSKYTPEEFTPENKAFFDKLGVNSFTELYNKFYKPLEPVQGYPGYTGELQIDVVNKTLASGGGSGRSWWGGGGGGRGWGGGGGGGGASEQPSSGDWLRGIHWDI